MQATEAHRTAEIADRDFRAWLLLALPRLSLGSRFPKNACGVLGWKRGSNVTRDKKRSSGHSGPETLGVTPQSNAARERLY
jgi:hypothetical protein